MQRFYETVIDTLTGAAVANAEVWVFNPSDNSAATIYSNTLGATINQPLISDSNGYVEFYATDGLYNLEFRAGGTTFRTITNVAIFDLPDLRADVDNILATYATTVYVDAGDAALAAAIALKLNASAVSAFGLTLIDDADAATARGTLGLGTMATAAQANYYTKAEVDALLAAILDGVTFTGPVVVPDAVYGGGWNGSAEVPTKNAVYDKIEAVIAAIPTLPAFYYNYGSFAVASVTASEVLMDHIVTVAHTLAASLAGCQCSVGSNPAATFALDVQKNGASIGTISIATNGVVTLSTSGGTSKAIAAGDVISVLAPAGVDASIARLRFTLRGTI